MKALFYWGFEAFEGLKKGLWPPSVSNHFSWPPKNEFFPQTAKYQIAHHVKRCDMHQNCLKACRFYFVVYLQLWGKNRWDVICGGNVVVVKHYWSRTPSLCSNESRVSLIPFVSYCELLSANVSGKTHESSIIQSAKHRIAFFLTLSSFWASIVMYWN